MNWIFLTKEEFLILNVNIKPYNYLKIANLYLLDLEMYAECIERYWMWPPAFTGCMCPPACQINGFAFSKRNHIILNFQTSILYFKSWFPLFNHLLSHWFAILFMFSILLMQIIVIIAIIIVIIIITILIIIFFVCLEGTLRPKNVISTST